MRDESRTVTVLCPRCGAPRVWAVREEGAGAALAAAAWPDRCTLSLDDWDDVARRLTAALGAPEEEPTG